MAQGMVAILSPGNDDRIIRVLRMGDHFGEMSMLYDSKRSTNIKALTWVSLQTLSRDDWKECKELFPTEMAQVELDLYTNVLKSSYKFDSTKTQTEMEKKAKSNTTTLNQEISNLKASPEPMSPLSSVQQLAAAAPASTTPEK